MKWMRSYSLSFSSSPPLPFFLLFPSSLSPLPDKLDAVGVFRKRKRLHSEVDEEEEGDSGELSLTEYLRRKQEESNLTTSGGKKKKRVSLPVPALALISIACITVKHNPGREPGIFSHVSMIYLGKSKGNTHLTYSTNSTLNATQLLTACCVHYLLLLFPPFCVHLF